jgi:alpha-mannosidase
MPLLERPPSEGARMHDDRPLVEERLERALRERLRPAMHSLAVPFAVAAWPVPPPVPGDGVGEPVPVAHALAAEYTPAAVGDAWGPPWGTTWLRLTGRVPREWAGREVEALIDLGFYDQVPGFQSEGLVHTADGVPLTAVNPRNTAVPLRGAHPGEEVVLYAEAASNPGIGGPVTLLGDRLTAGALPLYRLTRLDLAVLERDVWELVADLEVAAQLMRALPLQEPRRWELLRAIERSLDALDLQDVPASAAAARSELKGVLALPAHAGAHRISAVGHAHIDSAWLWPVRETVRKVARTVANVTFLLADDPAFVYAMSSAQQFAWLEEHQPALFERVREHVRAGRFVPVGGMWVESDTNMPGGEALARQFLHGKRYFLDRFGLETEEAWLPDSFGYSAALPQIVTLSGSRWFLTQKLSWNSTNRFPHHTFDWEGIDGTRLFTHFPPVDTYNSELSGAELAHAVANFAEKGRATRSLVPFGWGDGGGGPTREMLARAARTRDLAGSPRVTMESPRAFFTAAEAEYPDRPVWVGELYLEYHRGTYTSQARTKRGNRRSEHLLREAELWSASAAVAGLLEYPYDDLDRLWKLVLLNQFHDILPGSSIAWVHREAEETYARVAAELEEIAGRARRALAGTGADHETGADRETGGDGVPEVAFNAGPYPVDGVPALGTARIQVRRGTAADTAGEPATASRTGDGIVLDNSLLRVVVDRRGLVTSLVDRAADREVIAPGAVGNLLQLHPDLPNYWDAWDVDAFYRDTRTDLLDADSVEIVSEPGTAEGTAAVRIVRGVRSSTVTQILSLRPGQRRLEIDTEVDWHERETFLKLAFPLDVAADTSTSEIQFGHVRRAAHSNTSWDAARFEICAHRWLHVGEAGYGVALVNDATYGHDVSRPGRAGGGTTTTVRWSLLRAPRFPDPETDQGRHVFHHAVVPGAAIPDAVREGYAANLRVHRVPGRRAVPPLVRVDHQGVVVEAVKLAEDRSGDVVVRLYEAWGGRATARVVLSVPAGEVSETDLLERPARGGAALALQDDGAMALSFRPFQIRTLRFRISHDQRGAAGPPDDLGTDATSTH